MTGMTRATKSVTEKTFSDLVLDSPRPIIVDFWAAWCGPCRMIAPEIERIAMKYAGRVDVVKVDVDANPGLAQRYGIMSIPTIALFRSGQEAERVVGFRAAGELEATFGLASLGS